MGASILVVDDSALVRNRLAQSLGAAGFVVTTAVDGEDALEKLMIPPEPALVICDVNMPKMNGIELLEQMKENGVLARTTVLMLTTEGQPELIAQARALGAKGWIIKPFRPELLVAAAQRLTGTS